METRGDTPVVAASNCGHQETDSDCCGTSGGVHVRCYSGGQRPVSRQRRRAGRRFRVPCTWHASMGRQPKTMTHTSETRFRARYSETDKMGVIYYANYLVWMEMGRTDYCKSVGFDYREMELDGANMAVAEATCRYV